MGTARSPAGDLWNFAPETTLMWLEAVRSFTVEEEKRIATVSACLTCHLPAPPDGTELEFCAHGIKACAPIPDCRAAFAGINAKCLITGW